MAAESSRAAQIALVRCAQELSQIRSEPLPSDQTGGPMFFMQGVALGSLRVSNSSKVIPSVWLLVATEGDNFALPVRAGKTNRLSFVLPSPDPRRQDQWYFVGISHSDVFGVKILDFAVGLPPTGRAASDYRFVRPLQRSRSTIRRQMVQVVAHQLQEIEKLRRRGLLSRDDLLSGNISLCQGLTTGADPIALWIDHQVSELELVSRESYSMGGRAPASMFNEN